MILKERICEAAPLLAELEEVAVTRGKTVAQVAFFFFGGGAWEDCGWLDTNTYLIYCTQTGGH